MPMPTLISERPRSLIHSEAMEKILPSGVNSPVRNCKAVGVQPLIVEKGRGDLITDVDGHEYIDFCCSWGALILGHAHPQILEAIQQAVERGTSFGISTPLELEAASLVQELVPSIEKLRFVSSGTEATMTAVRLARGATGKRNILKFTGNYHGHVDGLLVKSGSGAMGIEATASSAGIPSGVVAHTHSLNFNDVEEVQAYFNSPAAEDLAGVIVEPVAANMGVVPASKEFLQALKEGTQRHGAMLIFDEVITGFRIALGGAQEYYGIEPDLVCMGKIAGGGLPAAVVGGPEAVMQYLAPVGKVYQAGTLSGNPVAMAASAATLRLLRSGGKALYQTLEHKANLITEPVRAAIKEKGINACVQQCGSLFTLFFGTTSVHTSEDVGHVDSNKYAELFRFLFERGIYFPPSAMEACFVSAAHTESHLMSTRDAILDFLNQS